MQTRGVIEVVIHEGVIRSWWVYLFALISYAGYEVVSAGQNRLQEELQERQSALEHSLAAEAAHHQELRAQLAAQSDPAWVELTLMRRLGVVPAGQTKVYFYESTP